MADFSKRYRLASKLDFQSVFDKPHRYTQKNILILFRANLLTHPRLGIILNKHHLKKAVSRNAFRRIVRESFRQQRETLSNMDIIVLLRSGFKPFDPIQIRKDVDTLWQRIKKSSD